MREKRGTTTKRRWKKKQRAYIAKKLLLESRTRTVQGRRTRVWHEGPKSAESGQMPTRYYVTLSFCPMDKTDEVKP